MELELETDAPAAPAVPAVPKEHEHEPKESVVMFDATISSASKFRRDRSKRELMESINAKIGPFYFKDTSWDSKGKPNGISIVEKSILQSLLPLVNESLLQKIVEFNVSNTIPRRLIDFTLVNTWKRDPVYRLPDSLTSFTAEAINGHHIYEREQAVFHRDGFDIFRRGEYIWFKLEGAWHFTTAAQLNFFCREYDKFNLKEVFHMYQEELQKHKAELDLAKTTTAIATKVPAPAPVDVLATATVAATEPAPKRRRRTVATKPPPITVFHG